MQACLFRGRTSKTNTVTGHMAGHAEGKARAERHVREPKKANTAAAGIVAAAPCHAISVYVCTMERRSLEAIVCARHARRQAGEAGSEAKCQKRRGESCLKAQ